MKAARGVKVGRVRAEFSPEYRQRPPNSPVFPMARKNGLAKLGTWGTEIHPDQHNGEVLRDWSGVDASTPAG